MEDQYTSLSSCILLQDHNYPGVYFLRQGEQIVYVGQSRKVMGRVAGHIGAKMFDSVWVMPSGCVAIRPTEDGRCLLVFTLDLAGGQFFDSEDEVSDSENLMFQTAEEAKRYLDSLLATDTPELPPRRGTSWI